MTKGTSPMSENIAEKILYNLETHHGCSAEAVQMSAESSILKIQDVFGFIHLVEVKTIGRISPELVKDLKPASDKLLERVK